MYYTIYLITNLVNNKRYVGYTQFKLKDRINNHRSDAKRGSKFLIHKAIRKYGWDNFKAEILYMSKDEEHTRKEMESYFVTEYRAFGQYGYNMTPGSDSHSPDTKQKISAAKKGKPLPWMIGQSHMSNFIWVNNGTDTMTHPKDQPMPEGYVRGRILGSPNRIKPTVRPKFPGGYRKKANIQVS